MSPTDRLSTESTPTALVTGATGFLGARLVKTLHDGGYALRALVRPTSDVAFLKELGVELVRGDLRDPGSLRGAVAGQRLVFHLAGRVSDWGPRGAFFAVNAAGTESLVAACQEAGVRRLVHMSSLSVLGLPRSGQWIDETSSPGNPGDAYSESKLAGERLVRAAHGRGGLSTTVVRSGVIWGEGEPTIMPRFAALLRRGRLPYVGGGHNVVALSHVENLAVGLRLAAETPRAAGELYHILDQEQITARQAVNELARAIGAPPPRVSLPYPVVHALATALEFGARLRRTASPPALTRYGVRLVSCDCRYDTRKANRELGYEPRVAFSAEALGLDRHEPC